MQAEDRRRSDPTKPRRWTNHMEVYPVNPPLIHVLDEDAGGATDQFNDTYNRITNQADRQNTPLDVDELQIPRGRKIHQSGDRDHPICVEDEEEGALIQHFELGCDVENPISVDQYDDALPQFSTGKSIMIESLPDLIVIDDLGNPGKKPSKTRFSNRYFSYCLSTEEVGESSCAPPCQPDSYCSICMDTKFSFECFSMKGCNHMYCTSCVRQYVAAKIEDNVTSIGCPDPGCKDGFLEPEMCRMILPQDVFDRWGSALCEMALDSKKFYCPFQDCSALLIDERGDDGEAITVSECPHCFRLFCAQCKVPWHMGVSCQEYKELGDDRDKEDLMLVQVAKSQQWKRCPKCKYYVERIAGCLFMRCRCGIQFCYKCASETTSDHYCAKCVS